MSDELIPETPVKDLQPSQDANAVVGRMLARVLAGRALRATGAALVACLAGWAMWQPTLLRAAIAGGFAIFTLLSQLIGHWSER